MKIGITGITGLIGRHVAALAKARGHEVIGFSRNPGHAGPGARRFTPDQPPDVTGCDAILNLAGENVAGLWTPAKKRAIKESRINGTRLIVEAIRAANPAPRVLVNASGTGIYQDTGDTAVDETAPHGNGFLAQTCEEWEAEALRANDAGARVAFLRTGLVLTPQGGALGAMLPIFRLGLGGKLGSGRQWVPWIHINDEAALALEALENESIEGPLNCTSPHPVRNFEFTNVLGKAVHRPALFWVPAFAIKLATGGFSAELLESRRIVPAAAARASFTFQFPALEAALADLLKTV